MLFEIVVISTTAIPTPFKARTAVSHGRIDVLGRAIISAFVGNSLPQPEKIHLVFLGEPENPTMISLSSEDVTEPLIEPRIAKMLSGLFEAKPEPTPSWMQELIKKEEYQHILLDYEGDPFETLSPKNSSQKTSKRMYWLGAQTDIPRPIIDTLSEQTLMKSLSLGKTQYFASQVITILRYLHAMHD